MEFTGKIIVVLPQQGGTSAKGNDWKKQGYVIETVEQHPMRMAFDIWNDDIAKYSLAVGMDVTVHFGINAREYQGRWYNDIKVWKVENYQVQGQQQQQMTSPSPAPQQSLSAEQQQNLNNLKNAFDAEESDPNNPDLPF